MMRYCQSEKDAAIRLYRKGWGYLRISQVVGCSASTIRKWIVASGECESSERSRRHPEDLKVKAVDYYLSEGLSLKRAALHFGVGEATLRRWVIQSGNITRKKRPDVLDNKGILQDLRDGIPKAEIARRRSCSETWVYRVQAMSRGNDA